MNKFSVLCLAGLLCFTLSGCAAKDPQNAESSGSTSSSKAEVASLHMVTGKVKSITGNEIELALGEYQASAGADAEGFGNGSGGNSSRGKSNQGSQNRSSTITATAAMGGMNGAMEMAPPEMPPDFAGGISPNEGSASQGEQGGSGAQGGVQKFVLSGETMVFSVPVTVPVTTASNSTTLNFSQILVKNIIQVTFDNSGETEIVSSIKILS